MSDPVCACASCSQSSQYALESVRIAASLLQSTSSSEAFFMAGQVVGLAREIHSFIMEMADPDPIKREFARKYAEVLARAKMIYDTPPKVDVEKTYVGAKEAA